MFTKFAPGELGMGGGVKGERCAGEVCRGGVRRAGEGGGGGQGGREDILPSALVGCMGLVVTD